MPCAYLTLMAVWCLNLNINTVDVRHTLMIYAVDMNALKLRSSALACLPLSLSHFFMWLFFLYEIIIIFQKKNPIHMEQAH